MRRLVEYSKGMPEHWCERGHLEYVLEGGMEVRFGDEIVAYSPWMTSSWRRKTPPSKSITITLVKFKSSKN